MFVDSNGACPLWRRLLDRAYAVSVFSWDNLVYLVLGLLVLFASKYLYWLQARFFFFFFFFWIDGPFVFVLC